MNPIRKALPWALSILLAMQLPALAYSVSSSVLSGALPALDGSALLSLNGTQITSGTIPLARLSGITTSQLSGSAGITGSQLSASAGILGSQLSASAAIAYSQLALTGAILNADLAGSIADSKLSQLTTANKVADSALTSNVPLKTAANTDTATGSTILDAAASWFANGVGNGFMWGSGGFRCAIGEFTPNGRPYIIWYGYQSSTGSNTVKRSSGTIAPIMLQVDGSSNIIVSAGTVGTADTDCSMTNIANIGLDGRVTQGNHTAGAFLQLQAGTATAGQAPMKALSGTLLSSAEAGACNEYDGTDFYDTPGSVRYKRNLSLTGSATYDAPSIAAAGYTTTTVTVTGSVVGDTAVPSFGVDTTGLVTTANITSNGTATVTLFNPTGSPIDLASTTLRVRATKQ